MNTKALLEPMGSWAWWRSWFLIFLGCSVMGAGFVLFVNPYKFVPGGVYGMGIVLHNIFPSIQVGTFGYMFDIPLMLTQLDKPNPLVAKKEIQKIPMIRGWMEQLHCVFLDRDDPRQSMECLRQAQELLGQGYSVVIFPEGTRNSGGPLGEFKAGAIRMATRAGVPVVPVCIDGSHLLMKKGSLWIHPAKVNIRILPPISTEGMARDEIRALPEQLRRQISDELDRLRG